MNVKTAGWASSIRRAVLSGLLAFVFLFTAVSCDGPTGNSAASGTEKKLMQSSGEENEPVTIKFISSWGGVDSKAETLKEVLAEFQKNNPGIRVEDESIFGEDFLPKIKTDFASGNDPDVFGLWPGSDIRALTKAGKVADLTDILNSDTPWRDSFKDWMWEYTNNDTHIYGLPVEIIFEGLFVNKDLFEKYKVKIPENYEELKRAVRVFRGNGIIPIAFNTMAEGTYLYQCIIASLGPQADVEKPVEAGKVKNCYLDALAYVKELYSMNAFPYDAFTLTNNERNILFKEKKAAMIVQGSWFIGDFAENPGSVDIIPFPKIKEGKNKTSTLIYGLGNGNFHMSSQANRDPARKEVSIKLLKALTSRETARLFSVKTGMINNVELGENEVSYNALTTKGLKLISESEQLVGPPDSFVDRTSWEDEIVKQLPHYLGNRISAEDLWKQAVKKGIELN